MGKECVMDEKMKVTWGLDLRRALLGEGKVDKSKGGTKYCNVCGMRDSRNHKALNGASTAHGIAVLNGYPSSWRQLTKALDQKVDFVTQGKFNAQITFLTGKLFEARAEHEAYEPTINSSSPSDRKTVNLALKRAIGKLGLKLGPNTAPDSAGEYSTLDLAAGICFLLSKLHREGKLLIDPLTVEAGEVVPLTDGAADIAGVPHEVHEAQAGDASTKTEEKGPIEEVVADGKEHISGTVLLS